MQQPSPSPSHDTLRFGRFQLQRHARRLLVDGLPASLGARAFDLLVVLAERPGELVGKNELLDRVWPGLVPEARPLAEAGWSQAERFTWQQDWSNYLALLAALEGQGAAAARLCGYSTAAYARSDGRRDVNEAAAFDRACRLAADALGDTEFERLQAEGRSLRDEDVAAMAFASGAA